MANVHRELPNRCEKVPARRATSRRASSQTASQDASQHSLVHESNHSGAFVALAHCQDPAGQKPLVLRSQPRRQVRPLL